MMTENEKNNELTLGEYEVEAATYSMRSTTHDTDNTTDDGDYTPPEDTTPEIESSTEAPGIHTQPSNPESGSVGSSTTGGVQSGTTTTIPIYISITYDLNGGLGITPETQTAKIGESVPLEALADPQKCYKLDNTFDG